tara:strand:- start:5 stop:319 length:315 start_codon:yes stop_codon:yes gene_type:complete
MDFERTLLASDFIDLGGERIDEMAAQAFGVSVQAIEEETYDITLLDEQVCVGLWWTPPAPEIGHREGYLSLEFLKIRGREFDIEPELEEGVVAWATETLDHETR